MSACAYFDSSDNSLNFVENTGGWTNGQVVGTKTYYTGFETDIYDSINRPPWYNQHSNVQIVNFYASVIPISTARWFNGFSNLIRINNLNLLNTSNVTNMILMFCDCSSLTLLNLSSFDTSDVTKMTSMFDSCTSLTSLDLSSFDTSNVTDMGHMFYNCSVLTSLDLSSFNTSNVKYMNYMFANCSSLISLNLSSFDTSNVTNMDSMFDRCSSLTLLDLSSFNTSNVTDMNYIFQMCSALTSLDLSNFDTSKITTMSYMFISCSALTSLDLSSFNTSRVTAMNGMFSGCGSLTSLDLSSFNTSQVTNMNSMFSNCNSLKYIRISNLWSLVKVTNSTRMFSNCTSLSNFDSTKTDKQMAYAGYPGYLVNSACAYYDSSDNSLNFVGNDNNYADKAVVGTKTYYKNIETSIYTLAVLPQWNNIAASIKEVKILTPVKPTSTSYWFKNCTNLSHIDLNLLDTSNVIDMSYMFEGCSSLTSLNLSNFNTNNITDMSYMFYNCPSLTSLDLSSFNTSNVTDMNGMFSLCTSLTSLDLSNFNTSKVTKMNFMFNNCQSLTSLDLSNFDTSNVTKMNNMFDYCSSLTSLDLNNFNTSNVTDMHNMFDYCLSLTSLDLNNFNTSNVTDMSFMFSICFRLTSLDVSSFNTSKVTNMGFMFATCQSLTSLDLSNFDTSNVTHMREMFSYCSSLTSLDLSNFNTSKVTDMRSMFKGCASLTSLNLSSFDTGRISNAVSGMANMFDGNPRLTVIIWDPDTTKDYSQIFDGVTDLYIIRPTNKRTDSTLATKWRNIIGNNSEVHFEYDHTLKPTITHTIERGKKVDNQWTPDDTEGTVIKLTYTPTVYQNDFSPLLETNALDNTVRAIYSDNTDISSLVTYTTEGTAIIAEFDIGDAAQHNITLQLQDKHDSPTLVNITLPGIFAMIEFRAGGKGMSIGKVSTRDGLDIAIPTTIGEGLIPPQEQQYVQTEDTVVDSNKTYYILNSNNQYEVVSNPTDEDIGNYYEFKYIEGTIDLTNYQLTIGKYNTHKPTALFIVGAGDDNANRRNILELDEAGLRLYAIDGITQLANIGYGEGQSQSGTATAPYYTFGVRVSGSVVGNYSVAEGRSTTASGFASHTEGYNTTASGYTSHAEGYTTTASGKDSHAEGNLTTASGIYSHAQNHGTIAAKGSQTAIGKYNIEDTATSTAYQKAFIIGNGTLAARSNALIVDWQGNVMAQGMAGMVQMYAGAGTQTVTDGVATTTNLPLGWLICDGSSLLIEEYPELAAALWDGTAYIYGAVDSTHFNLPDFRGRAPVGAGQGSGLTNRSLGTPGGDENIQAHTHGFTAPSYTTSGAGGHYHIPGVADRVFVTTADNIASGNFTRSSIKPGSGTAVTNVLSSKTVVGWATVTNTVANHSHTVNHTSGTGSVNAVSGVSTGDAGNMMPYLGINYIIATGKTA